ncbi:hypothetical protein ACDA63_17185 [Uliginosibacterium sp. sgz301328]|uniref:hypothetical protein n=1 Tax=Uliginosibacterium sp. sgz301328 TaxID=3243764 RepID=UPI00359E5310
MTRKRLFLLLIFPVLVGIAGLALLVNSMGCNYTLRSTHRDVDYYGVCRGGFVNLVETDLTTGSTWTVGAFQFSLADQLLFVVHSRNHIRESSGKATSVLDTYNRSLGAISFVNYAWMPVGRRRVVFFQTSPYHDVLTMTREGHISLWDAYFPYDRPAY